MKRLKCESVFSYAAWTQNFSRQSHDIRVSRDDQCDWHVRNAISRQAHRIKFTAMLTVFKSILRFASIFIDLTSHLHLFINSLIILLFSGNDNNSFTYDFLLIWVFRSYVQSTQVNSRSMQQTLSGALRRNAAFSCGTDRYSRRDECPQYGVPPRIHVPWRGTRVPGIPQLLPQGS